MIKSVGWIVCGILFFSYLEAEEARDNGFLPSGVEETDFQSLAGQSPFSRALNLSDSLILTGIATVENEQVATLINKDTKESYVVSSKLNSQGWKMVELQSDEDLEKVAAKVSVDGGEVVTVRYAEWQLKPGESKPGAGTAESGSMRGDGKGKGKGDGRRGPPQEMREKMQKLSEEQRNQLFTKMREFREKNPDVPREEMGKMMSGMMDRMMQQR
ncbi:MAG: hypothetical protein P1U58_12395 [Verrucomicrobiales bacterium]|nr:hypothetical protein [Verrucomicrobiales bacterium]